MENILTTLSNRKIQIVSLQDVEPYTRFRYDYNFWEMSKEKGIIWPAEDNPLKFKVINDWLRKQKVAII